MSSYGNFNVKPFEDLKEQASKVFGDLIENITTIKTECANMSDIVISDDSKLGTRWRDISEKMDQPIQTMEDSILVVKSLLDAYIANTLANEEQATKELEEIDNNITILASRAETLLSGLTSLRGIGFGASAIVIPGLAGWDPSIPTTTAGSLTDVPVAEVSEPVAVEKYAPPVFTEETQTAVEVTTKYAPPSDFEVVTKYAPPSDLQAELVTTTKYAPPTYTESSGTFTDVTTKYAPPSEFYTLADGADTVKISGSGSFTTGTYQNNKTGEAFLKEGTGTYRTNKTGESFFTGQSAKEFELKYTGKK